MHVSHISREFDTELKKISTDILKMGALVISHIEAGMDVLLNGNEIAAQQVMDQELTVNQMEIDIDRQCSEIIVRRQPSASDLRFVMTASKIITDLERIGDEAEKIARFGKRLHSSQCLAGYYEEYRNLAQHVVAMLKNALTAFEAENWQAALLTMEQDGAINQECEHLLHHLFDNVEADVKSSELFFKASWVARALERIGDHAANIGEFVIYSVRGQDVRHQRIDDIRKALDADPS